MIVYKVYRNVLAGTVIVFQGNQQILYNFSHNLSSLVSTGILAGRFIRALASARGSVPTRRARGQRARPLEGPKGPRVAKTCESEGPRTSKAKCPSRCLPVLLYVFHNSAQNREIHGPFSKP